MSIVLKGIDVVNAMKIKMIEEVEELKKSGINPTLGIVRIGSRQDDLAYERGAIKRCEGIGIRSRVFEYPEDISQKDFVKELDKLNKDAKIHGILLFRPLPKQINEDEIKYIIAPEKDIDCFNPVNVAKVFAGDKSGFAPCTPEAVIEILEHNNISLEGKNVVVIGRSMVVGKPLAMLLLARNATVTVCHTRTRNLQQVCRNAEIVIAAAGKAKMVTAEYISEGSIVIDVGINVDASGNLCGDVDFDAVEKAAAYITPVPGGVGTVTTSVLAQHVIKAAKIQHS